jgi:hypothetical protein
LLAILSSSGVSCDWFVTNSSCVHNNLESEIAIKKDNIITTSYPLVLIKNGILIALAIRYIKAPIVADICNTT